MSTIMSFASLLLFFVVMTMTFTVAISEDAYVPEVGEDAYVPEVGEDAYVPEVGMEVDVGSMPDLADNGNADDEMISVPAVGLEADDDALHNMASNGNADDEIISEVQESEKKAETVQESGGNAGSGQESEKKAETGTSEGQQNHAARARLPKDYVKNNIEAKGYVKNFTEVAAPLPTLTIEEFENDSTGMYRKFLRPFKLKAGFDNKPAKNKWTRDFFGKDSRFSQEIVAYYPDNLMEKGGKHYGRLTNAINEISQNGFIKADTPMYLLWNMLPGAWNELGKDIKLPEAFNTDKWWQSQCLSGEGGRLLEEFFIKTHWGMLTMGTTGAGMYNHSDSLQAGSWQAQVSGSKWWYLCGDLQHFAPDGETVITGEFKCFEDVVHEGEVVFYPSKFYHMTAVVDQPCLSYTGTQLDPVNYRSIMDSLHGECVYEKHNYRFSGMLCDALDKCYKLWDKKFRGNRERKKMPRWRRAAGKKEKGRRFRVSPWDNLFQSKYDRMDARNLHLK